MQNSIQPYRQLALIGPTASGKTSLSITLAKKINAYILSLDSLAIYKEIDIVSAKPTLEEREGILHFGI
ncbi:MAG: isopentenyl transferase family protein, partial [Campylobacterota bacterium]|nr:isopentenyl transferase family protein [Campylobacterota bacterium]